MARSNHQDDYLHAFAHEIFIRVEGRWPREGERVSTIERSRKFIKNFQDSGSFGYLIPYAEKILTHLKENNHV